MKSLLKPVHLVIVALCLAAISVFVAVGQSSFTLPDFGAVGQSSFTLPDFVIVEGVVSQIDAATITVAGETIRIQSAQVDPNAGVGATVEVSVTVQPDNSWLATEVSIQNATQHPEAHITGAIQAITGTQITIGGHVYDTASATITGTLAVGNIVELTLATNTNGQWSVSAAAPSTSSSLSMGNRDCSDDHLGATPDASSTDTPDAASTAVPGNCGDAGHGHGSDDGALDDHGGQHDSTDNSSASSTPQPHDQNDQQEQQSGSDPQSQPSGSDQNSQQSGGDQQSQQSGQDQQGQDDHGGDSGQDQGGHDGHH